MLAGCRDREEGRGVCERSIDTGEVLWGRGILDDWASGCRIGVHCVSVKHATSSRPDPRRPRKTVPVSRSRNMCCCLSNACVTVPIGWKADSVGCAAVVGSVGAEAHRCSGAELSASDGCCWFVSARADCGWVRRA